MCSYHVSRPNCPDATKPRDMPTSPFARILINLCTPACMCTQTPTQSVNAGYALRFQIQPQKAPSEEETWLRKDFFLLGTQKEEQPISQPWRLRSGPHPSPSFPSRSAPWAFSLVHSPSVTSSHASGLLMEPREKVRSSPCGGKGTFNVLVLKRGDAWEQAVKPLSERAGGTRPSIWGQSASSPPHGGSSWGSVSAGSRQGWEGGEGEALPSPPLVLRRFGSFAGLVCWETPTWACGTSCAVRRGEATSGSCTERIRRGQLCYSNLRLVKYNNTRKLFLLPVQFIS